MQSMQVSAGDLGELLRPLLRGGKAATTPDDLWRSGVLPLGRTTIYAECHRYLETEGHEGIPCVLVGEKRIIIPIASLARWLGISADGAEVQA